MREAQKWQNDEWWDNAWTQNDKVDKPAQQAWTDDGHWREHYDDGHREHGRREVTHALHDRWLTHDERSNAVLVTSQTSIPYRQADADVSDVEQTREVACAGDCGYVCTWYGSHCCKACEEGRGHGRYCDFRKAQSWRHSVHRASHNLDGYDALSSSSPEKTSSSEPEPESTVIFDLKRQLLKVQQRVAAMEVASYQSASSGSVHTPAYCRSVALCELASTPADASESIVEYLPAYPGGGDAWSYVRGRSEYCLLCNAYADSGHLGSDKHIKRFTAWQNQQARPADAPPPKWGHPILFEKTGDWWKCKLCGKNADSVHVKSEGHKKRLQWHAHEYLSLDDYDQLRGHSTSLVVRNPPPPLPSPPELAEPPLFAPPPLRLAEPPPPPPPPREPPPPAGRRALDTRPPPPAEGQRAHLPPMQPPPPVEVHAAEPKRPAEVWQRFCHADGKNERFWWWHEASGEHFHADSPGLWQQFEFEDFTNFKTKQSRRWWMHKRETDRWFLEPP